MPWYRVGGKPIHLRLGKSKHPPPAQCHAPGDGDICRGIAAFECDWDLGHGLTFGMPLCPACALEIGPNQHYCPKHALEAQSKGE